MTDEMVGQVRRAWDSYLEKNNREGIFVYLSDHGDMIGNRGYWGKESLYEDSEHIPFIMAGSGIPKGKAIDCPVSIMDLGPTLCEMAGIEGKLPEQDGVSLTHVVEEDAHRGLPVIAERISNPRGNGTDFGRMVIQDGWKLITYNTFPGDDQLFNLAVDPWEMKDLSKQEPVIAAQLRELAYRDVDVETVIARKIAREEGINLVKKFARMQRAKNTETWEPTPEQAQWPEKFVSTKTPLIPPMQAAWEAGSFAAIGQHKPKEKD